jgi:cytochrome c-type biogenesis protein CcmE
MKKTHIFLIAIIAVAVMVIVSTAGDASSYVTFQEAKELAQSGKNKKIHVVGELNKTESGRVVGITPSADMLSFSFEMIDQNNEIQTVYYSQPMPTDFLRSEQVVVIGSFRQDQFVADKILMKCPSKYQETELAEAK